MLRIRQGSRGFTLVELLIVSAVLAVVSLAIYSTFNNGLKIWQKINKQLLEEDSNIFMDRFAHDLRNSLKFTGISFSGRVDRLAFPTMVNSARMQKITVGQAIYFYDPGTETLTRELRDFSHVCNDESGITQQTLKNVSSLRFQYYLYDAQKKEYLWMDEYQKEGLPLAVRMEADFSNGKETLKFIRTISIPLGA